MDIQLFIWLLLLQLLACASCNKCPTVEDISPCKCRRAKYMYAKPGEIDINCKGVSLQEIDGIFDHLRGETIYNATIRNVEGDRLPSNLFRNMSVKVLVINNCDLRGLSDTDDGPAFVGLENSLDKLYVWRSIKGDNQLKTLDLSHLKNLKFLDLEANNIPEVGNDWFARGPFSLESVSIDYSGLNKIGDTAFAPLVNLNTLILSGNGLISIDRSMIAKNPAPHFRVLLLNDNNLTRLPDDIFSGMPSLHMIFLGENSIRRLEETTWSSQWEKIEFLTLADNPLECDSHMEWMFSLKTIKFMRAYCASPDTLKGMRLKYFIERNRKLM